MRRGLFHPEPTVQQKAYCLTHNSLGCICSTHGSFGSLPNYSFYSWGQSPTAWVSSCSSLNSLQQEVLLCFSEDPAPVSRQQLFGGTGISYFSCQLTCSSPQQGHTHQGELTPSAGMELAAAPRALHSRRERAGLKVFCLRPKKKYLGLLPQCNNLKTHHKTVLQSIANLQSSTTF